MNAIFWSPPLLFLSIRFPLQLPLIAFPLHPPPLHLLRHFSDPFCFPSNAYLWILHLLWMRNYCQFWSHESFWIFWLSLTSECFLLPLLQWLTVWILSRQDYGKTPDDDFLGSQNNGFCIFTTNKCFFQELRVTECKISMQNLIVITRTGHWNPSTMSRSLNLSAGRPVFS